MSQITWAVRPEVVEQDGRKQTRVTLKSPLFEGDRSMTLDCTLDQFRRGQETWGHQPIQNAFPMLSADEREFLLNGSLPGDFPDDDDGVEDGMREEAMGVSSVPDGDRP